MSAATIALREARDNLLALVNDKGASPDSFEWPDVGPVFNWGHDWFDAFARGNHEPGLIVVEEDGSAQTLTFDELVDSSDQVAHWLRRRGVSKGHPVLVMLNNQLELWQVMLAIIKLGAVVVPTTTAAGESELGDRVTRSGAGFVVCNADDAWKFDTVVGSCEVLTTSDLRAASELPAVPVEHPMTSTSDPLLLYFTSGTTTAPKLVEHTQISYPVGHLSTMAWIGLRPGDIHLNVSSPGWAKHAWSSFFAPWLAEATVLVYNYVRFDPEALLRELKARNVTTFCAPPTVWRMLINADLSGGPGRLRELVAAGEPLNPEVIEQVRRAWSITIRDGFGQTETTALIGNLPHDKVKHGSMGKPLPGVPVVLIDAVTGAANVAEGELCLDLTGNNDGRPLNLMTGYLGDSRLHASAMNGGYYHTGDVASMDADGYITFIGRTDDVFKASDYKISPFELESVLLKHPAVAEAAVVPAPDPVRLAVPKAYVALSPGYEATAELAFDVLRFAREHLAPYQRIRRLEFSSELPKTFSGKIRRVDLRERETNNGSARQAEFRDDEFPALRSQARDTQA